jgi:hypothetical protein
MLKKGRAELPLGGIHVETVRVLPVFRHSPDASDVALEARTLVFNELLHVLLFVA